jgi:hypothetical protein
MPVVTLTENNQPRYYAVTHGNEGEVAGLVTEYLLSDGNNREYVEHTLKQEYLKRLTEHAYDCAHLAHFVLNPPDDEEQIACLGIVDRLARKITEDAVWLRTYDPFVALTADAVDAPEGQHGTRLMLDGELASSLDADSWEVGDRVLRRRDPRWRDIDARVAKERAEEDAAREAKHRYTPAGEKRVAEARDAFVAACDYARKLKERSEARRERRGRP